MSKQPIYRQQAARLLRARLDRKHPGFRGSAEIAAALRQMGPYIDSYVLPLLDVLAGEDQPVNWVRDMLVRDCATLTRDEALAGEPDVPMPWCEPCRCYHAATAEHVADVQKRARLRNSDTARLDWLETGTNHDFHLQSNGAWFDSVTDGSDRAPTLREAIDRAMKIRGVVP